MTNRRTEWPSRVWRRAAWRSRLGGLALAVVAVVGLPGAVFAHLALREAAPTADARLGEVPREVVLAFTLEIELPLSSLTLTGPEGEVRLGPLGTDEAGRVMRAAITGEIVAGEYTVRWQAVGLDGHPVRGGYGFVVAEGAEGLAPALPAVEAAAPRLESPQVAAVPEAPRFDSRSPLYAGVRWLTYTGILGTTGAVGFTLLLLGLGRVPDPTLRGFGARALGGALGLGLLASLTVAVALALRLQAQSHALFAGGITGERFALLLQSSWGLGWAAQAAGAAAALVGFTVARRAPAAGLAFAALGAFGLSVSPGLSGHAAAVEPLTGAAIFADGLHVLGAGTWLGTLLALVLVGIPMARREPPPQRAAAVRGLVTAFSPIALAAAALVFATGAFSSYVHLTGPQDLWTTAYGRLLVAKLLLVAIVAAAGAFNWRRLGPATGQPGVELKLRRSAGVELAAAALVIALTSVLVAAPPPADADTGPQASETPSTLLTESSP